ncbi:MAG TPA: dihydrolipoamide acetyltransferase family protein [Ktedonobacteraceae bacterium]|nr:dihydrolipoamide acetyltransferase family protein [Ktedonobacteraceae bacterium]
MPEITMPRLSDTMQEGTITRWLKKPGDEIKRGDIIAEVETDKANMEIEAYDTGTLEQIVVNEGQTASIGQVIAIVGSGAGTQKQASPATTRTRTKDTPSSAARETATRSVQVANSKASRSAPGSHAQTLPVACASDWQNGEQGDTNNSKIKASPLARRMAEEHNIDLNQIQGTGPGGRIVRDDIEDFLERATPILVQPAVPQQEVPVVATAMHMTDVEISTPTSMQKTIARRLTESKQTIPHFYIGNDIDMTDALTLRQMFNASAGEKGLKISVNDLIVKSCALALEKFPEINCSWMDGQFVQHKRINIGIAVDIPAGLIVPVIHDANIKGVRSIAREAKTLAEKARASKLTPADLEGGTFSISNLGMIGVTDFIAVINPPEAAIMAIASVRKTYVPIDGQPVIRDLMHVTVSADHRILYGATVARFLQEVKQLLENPYMLLG